MAKKYHENNREKVRAKNVRWKANNPEKVKAISQRQWANPSYKIQKRLCENFKNWLFKGVQSPCTERLVGCTREEARNWIEAQFLPGMTWENYGAWQIDHMLPWEHFNLFESSEHPKVMHYTNIQPLWGPDNQVKNSKIIYDMQWRDTWYIHTGTEHVCRKEQVENKIQIKIKPIVGFTQGFAHVFGSI
tara:strand:- start:266 stop:832 length:567 start_codon:yes stop_codon:yes gene_type:complete